MKIAIVSLRFAPGHIAHLRAYKKLFSSIGCETRLFLEKRYKGFIYEDSEVVFLDALNDITSWGPDKVFSYNIASDNISLARWCKKNGIPFFYVLHEPWDSFNDLIALGKRIPRRIVANVVNYIICRNAYKVILASENGKRKYLKYMKGCNNKYAVFPLIFCDDYNESLSIERQYFSFIGGFTEPRACSEFIDFIKYTIDKGLRIKFCIATRNDITGYLNDTVLQQSIKKGSLIVQSGKPMTTDEINLHYREAVCTWNAYKVSTQSGVLPNSLMQGAPVIVTERGDSKDAVTEKREGCYVSIPLRNEEIESAYEYIEQNIKEMSNAARDSFHRKYEYKIYRDKAIEVYEIK